jgi:hypothetical protein
MRRAGISEGLIMRIGGWKTRKLEEHEKKLAAARNSYNSGYSEQLEAENTLPGEPTNPIVVN